MIQKVPYLPKEILTQILNYNRHSWWYNKETLSRVIEIGKILRKTKAHLRYMLLYTPLFFDTPHQTITYEWAVEQLKQTIDIVKPYINGYIVQRRMATQCTHMLKYYITRHIPKNDNTYSILMNMIER